MLMVSLVEGPTVCGEYGIYHYGYCKVCGIRDVHPFLSGLAVFVLEKVRCEKQRLFVFFGAFLSEESDAEL